MRAPWLFLAIVLALAVLELAAGEAGLLPKPIVATSDDGSDDWYR